MMEIERLSDLGDKFAGRVTLEMIMSDSEKVNVTANIFDAIFERLDFSTFEKLGLFGAMFPHIVKEYAEDYDDEDVLKLAEVFGELYYDNTVEYLKKGEEDDCADGD